MFDAVTTEGLRELARTTTGHHLSVFMPTHPPGAPARAQDPIRLRQLLDRARDQLVDLGMRRPDAEEFLAPATALVGDAAFWTGAGSGIAVFLDADGLRHYRLAHAPEPRSVIADRFQLRPLVPAVAHSDHYWVLSLSQHDVRLLRGNRAEGLRRIGLGDVPTSLEEALRFDDRERQLQSHASSRAGAGGVAMTMHGQGGIKDTTDDERTRFCRIVDGYVRPLVEGGTEPIVLAGERRLLDEFRKVCHLDRLAPRDVVGNPDHLTDQQLGDAAWDIVSDLIEQQLMDDTEVFSAAVENRVSSLDETVLAAIDGKVDTVIVPLGVEHLGELDLRDRVVIDRPAGSAGVGDLYDLTVAEVLRHGGRVHAVDAALVPGPGPVAATLRY
ncbi:MAG: hypothetical protein R2733_20035 [Acidimicrobiales bacterium]